MSASNCRQCSYTIRDEGVAVDGQLFGIPYIVYSAIKNPEDFLELWHFENFYTAVRIP